MFLFSIITFFVWYVLSAGPSEISILFAAFVLFWLKQIQSIGERKLAVAQSVVPVLIEEKSWRNFARIAGYWHRFVGISCIVFILCYRVDRHLWHQIRHIFKSLCLTPITLSEASKGKSNYYGLGFKYHLGIRLLILSKTWENLTQDGRQTV